MFEYCSNPDTLSGLTWLSCYLTTAKHTALYVSFGTVILLLVITAPVSLLFGFFGAASARSLFLPVRWVGKAYIALVRGVPDISLVFVLRHRP